MAINELRGHDGADDDQHDRDDRKRQVALFDQAVGTAIVGSGTTGYRHPFQVKCSATIDSTSSPMAAMSRLNPVVLGSRFSGVTAPNAMPIAIEMVIRTASQWHDTGNQKCGHAGVVHRPDAGTEDRKQYGNDLRCRRRPDDYTGMSALPIPGVVHWDAVLITISIAMGMAFGAVALNLEPSTTGFKRDIAAIGPLSLSIVALHFTGMGAITVVPDPTIAVPPGLIEKGYLAFAVVVIMLIVVGTVMAAQLIDRHAEREALSHYRHLAMHDADGIAEPRIRGRSRSRLDQRGGRQRQQGGHHRRRPGSLQGRQRCLRPHHGRSLPRVACATAGRKAGRERVHRPHRRRRVSGGQDNRRGWCG